MASGMQRPPNTMSPMLSQNHGPHMSPSYSMAQGSPQPGLMPGMRPPMGADQMRMQSMRLMRPGGPIMRPPHHQQIQMQQQQMQQQQMQHHQMQQPQR